MLYSGDKDEKQDARSAGGSRSITAAGGGGTGHYAAQIQLHRDRYSAVDRGYSGRVSPLLWGEYRLYPAIDG